MREMRGQKRRDDDGDGDSMGIFGYEDDEEKDEGLGKGFMRIFQRGDRRTW